MDQRAPCVATAYFFLRRKHGVRRYLVQHGGEGAQKTLFVKLMGTLGIAVAHQQIECEQERCLDETQFRAAIPIAPIKLFNIGSEQPWVDGGQTVPGQHGAAVTAENEPAFVLTDQTPYGANIRTNRMILFSDNITENLFVQ
jgi:hypothetical protein